MKKIGLNPFDVPERFRSYLYNHVVLAWETGQVDINKSKFNKKNLEVSLGFRVENLRKLSDVEMRVSSLRNSSEILIFYVDGRGYECLFKRLRDAFAHGHYGKAKSDWIAIRHRFKGRNEKSESTRLFARLRQSTLKKLVELLDQTSCSRRETTDV
ncbi:MAG: hypothetical protein PHX10_00500 [Gallionellaceae bacterium]|nr:hypothetical protein [Gallionellaceae bacterium]